MGSSLGQPSRQPLGYGNLPACAGTRHKFLWIAAIFCSSSEVRGDDRTGKHDLSRPPMRIRLAGQAALLVAHSKVLNQPATRITFSGAFTAEVLAALSTG